MFTQSSEHCITLYSARFYRNQFHKWGWQKENTQSSVYRNTALQARVKDLYKNNFTLEGMFRALQEDGFRINRDQLKLLRWRPSMRCLYRRSPFQTEEERQTIAQNAMWEALESGQAIRYGRTYGSAAIRQTGVFVSE